MPSRRGARSLATPLLLTAAGVALGVLWAVRRQPRLPIAAPEKPTPVRVLPPSHGGWLADEPQFTAIPHDAAFRLGGADDYEAISPEDLSSAFLSRATESSSETEEGELDVDLELQGFQITTIEDLTLPELRDDPADFEIPMNYKRERRGRKSA